MEALRRVVAGGGCSAGVVRQGDAVIAGQAIVLRAGQIGGGAQAVEIDRVVAGGEQRRRRHRARERGQHAVDIKLGLFPVLGRHVQAVEGERRAVVDVGVRVVRQEGVIGLQIVEDRGVGVLRRGQLDLDGIGALAAVIDVARAFAADEYAGVVTVAAEHLVGSAAAIQHIVAGAAVHRVVGAAADNRVVAVATVHLVRTAAAGDRIVAGAAIQRVVGAAADDRVVAVLAVNYAGAAIARDQVIARAAVDRLVAAAADNRVVARAAVIGVGPIAAVQIVVAAAAVYRVVADPAVDAVTAVAVRFAGAVAVQHVVTGIAIDDIVAGVALHRVVAVAAIGLVIVEAAVQHVIAGPAIQRILTRGDGVGTRLPAIVDGADVVFRGIAGIAGHRITLGVDVRQRGKDQRIERDARLDGDAAGAGGRTGDESAVADLHAVLERCPGTGLAIGLFAREEGTESNGGLGNRMTVEIDLQFLRRAMHRVIAEFGIGRRIAIHVAGDANAFGVDRNRAGRAVLMQGGQTDATPILAEI